MKTELNEQDRKPNDMEEQKQTPGPKEAIEKIDMAITFYENGSDSSAANRLYEAIEILDEFVSAPEITEKYKTLSKEYTELLERVSSLTKENERLKEQVEYWKNFKDGSSEAISQVLIDRQVERIAELEQEKKEMVEALREIKAELYSAVGHSNTIIILRHLSKARELSDSLLSKFEP